VALKVALTPLDPPRLKPVLSITMWLGRSRFDRGMSLDDVVAVAALTPVALAVAVVSGELCVAPRCRRSRRSPPSSRVRSR